MGGETRARSVSREEDFFRAFACFPASGLALNSSCGMLKSVRIENREFSEIALNILRGIGGAGSLKE